MDVFDLTAKLTLDSSEYDAGLDKAGSKASGWASKLGSGLGTAAKVSAAGLMAAAGAGVAVAGAFMKGAAAVADYGDNIDKMSQKMGMSSTAYQEWDAVMRHSGTSMETLKASMKTLATAAETGKDAFDKLGISQQQIASMSQEELFSATITALQGVTDETERTYLAGQLLGRGATELGPLLNQSAEETQAMKDRLHELGGVMSEDAVKAAAQFKDSLQDMHAAIDGAKRSLVEGFLPSMSTVMEGISDVISGVDVEGGLAKIEEGVNGFIENLNDVIPRVVELAARIIPAFAEAIVTNIPRLAQTGLDVILSLANGIANHIPDLIARLPQIIVGIVNFITSNLPAIIQTGIHIIIAIIQGIAQALPQLIAAAPQILMAIAQGILSTLQIIWQSGPEIIRALGEGLRSAFGALINLGADLVRAIIEGVLSALGWLGDAIISVFDGALSEADSRTKEYRSLGEHAATETTEGYRSKSGEFGTVVEKSINDGKARADSAADGFTGSGGTAGDNWLSGWAKVDMSTAVDGSMSGAVKTANGWAPQFTAPANAAIDYLAQPFWNSGEVTGGVDSMMGSAQAEGQAGAVEFGQVGANMVSQTVSSIAATASQISSAARGVIVTAFTVANAATSMFVSVGVNIASGIARGISAGTPAIAAAARSAVSAALAAAKAAAAIASPSKKFRDEVGYYMGLGIAEGLEDSEDEAVKAADELAKKVYDKSREWLRREIKFNHLSLRDQLAYWEEIQSQFIQESAQYADAEEQIFDLRENIQDNFRDNVEKIWDNIADAYDNYSDTLAKRTQQIADSYGLFDDVQDRTRLSGAELLMNLQRQVNVMGDFYKELDQLTERGASEDMVQQIREMGPKAIDQLDALLSMTDQQFEKYVSLFGEKQQIANETALKELSGLRAETAEEIMSQLQELEKVYEDNSSVLGETFVAQVASGIEESMGQVVAAAKQLAQEANAAFYATLDPELRSKTTTFGSSALGAASAQIINTVAQRDVAGGTYSINLNVDGNTIAKTTFDPMKNYAASKGQPIVAAT